ncbi:hypothetical protein [Pseudomonas monsensis]
MADLITGLDGPRTPQQGLFYGLEDSTAVIGWVAAQLAQRAEIAKGASDTAALIQMCDLLKAEQAKLLEYAHEVKIGKIVRA